MYAFQLEICQRIISVKIDLTTHHAIFEYVVHTDVHTLKIFLENSMYSIYTRQDSNYRSTIERKINLFLF